MKHLPAKLHNKSHVLWDFNGTLLNDAHLCVRAVNVLLLEHGLKTITLDEYHQVFDFPVVNYYGKLGFDFQKESFADLSHRFHQLYHASLDDAEVFPGVVELIQDLNSHTHHVLSAAQKDDLTWMLGRFGISSEFRSVYGLGDRLAHSKVELGRQLLTDQKIEPQDCVMIGDTLHDLEVAEHLGIEVFLITGGHQHESRLRSKTDRILARP